MKSISPRERVSLNSGWRFQKEDAADVKGQLDYNIIKPWLLPSRNAFIKDPVARASSPEGEPGRDAAFVQSGFDDSGWRQLSLPHDWGIEGPFKQEYPGSTGKLPWWGVGWYRKHFDVKGLSAGERYTLEVDGAMSHAAVWLNGRFVGGWPYGYASFQLDLTAFVKPGDNVLAIRLDNVKDSSRWYPGGGIYRNVWLLKTGSVRVGQWGTYVTTPDVSNIGAKVMLKAEIVSDADRATMATVATEILFQGKPAGMLAPQVVTIPAHGRVTVGGATTITNPQLWNVKTPNTYTAVTTVSPALTGLIVPPLDRYETTFGIRSIKFTADNGFLLNGERVQIQGVCNHHDLGALGAAFNVRAAERQLEIMKEMGVNALRTSHNPPAPELLDLCDCMGILVMDEAFDCWKSGKCSGDYHTLWEEWHEADLRALIRRDRNHPSVIIWSLGNEIPDVDRPEGNAIAAALTKIAHEEDPPRPTSAGVDNVKGVYNCFADNIDIFGLNYKPRDFGRFRQDRPTQPLYASETASTVSSRGEYNFPVTARKETGRFNFQVSSHDLTTCNWSELPDADFAGEDRYTFGAGQFVWTGFDYLGEPAPYNNKAPSRSSYFGIVDLAGFKKDRFYLYQARWRPELPMAHILPHWNWPDRVGQVTPVFVYTSGDEAELFLNGKSVGRRVKAKVAPWPANVAEGKVVSASGGDGAALAVDGRVDTIWQADKGSLNSWWQVDLGSVQPLKAVEVNFNGCAKNFNYRMVASKDGSVWQPLVTETEAFGDQTHIDYPVDVRARFLRVEFLSDNKPRPAIKEVAAYLAPVPIDEDCYRLRWNEVTYEPGELKAIAYKGGKKWAEASMKTTGPAARLLADADRAVIRADGNDLSFVTVIVADKAGLEVPGSKNLLVFKLSGPGEIVGLDNGDATSFEPFQGNEHHAWNGKCLVIIRSKAGNPGDITLSVSSEGLIAADVKVASLPETIRTGAHD